MRFNEGVSWKYKFTGDSYIDYVLSYWLDWYNNKYKKNIELTTEQEDDFINHGFDKLAEIIFEEFPICASVKNCDFDAEYCWEEFLDTKEGRIAKDYIEHIKPIIDTDYVSEYIDDDFLAESIGSDFNLVSYFEDAKLKKKDLKEVLTAFNEGVTGTFQNGWSFNPSEFVRVVACANDEYGHTENDLTKIMKDGNSKLNKTGKLYAREIIWNSRLYDGYDVDAVIEIDLKSIVDGIKY